MQRYQNMKHHKNNCKTLYVYIYIYIYCDNRYIQVLFCFTFYIIYVSYQTPRKKNPLTTDF